MCGGFGRFVRSYDVDLFKLPFPIFYERIIVQCASSRMSVHFRLPFLSRRLSVLVGQLSGQGVWSCTS